MEGIIIDFWNQDAVIGFRNTTHGLDSKPVSSRCFGGEEIARGILLQLACEGVGAADKQTGTSKIAAFSWKLRSFSLGTAMSASSALSIMLDNITARSVSRIPIRSGTCTDASNYASSARTRCAQAVTSALIRT